jgi:hypothetical protein
VHGDYGFENFVTNTLFQRHMAAFLAQFDETCSLSSPDYALA